VAYLVPSCNDINISKMDFELKLLECLRFLVESKDYQARKCAAVALTHRWINVLQPNYIINREGFNSTADANKYLHARSRLFPSGSGSRHILLGGQGRRQEKRRELLEMREVIEKTVALVLALADSEVDMQACTSSSLGQNIAFVVESMCGGGSASCCSRRDHQDSCTLVKLRRR